MNTYVFGIVVNNIFYSSRIEKSVNVENGIYCVDMEQDDFMSTLQLADIEDALKYFKKSDRFSILRGVGWNSAIVPENPVKFNQIPINVIDAQFENFDFVEIIKIKNIHYFLQILFNDKTFALDEIKEIVEKEGSVISGLKNITPEMRIAFSFYLIEKKKREKIASVDHIKASMENCGATNVVVTKNNNGYTVKWTLRGHRITTLLNKSFSVTNAGFCVSGYDRTQHLDSVARLLEDYVDEGSYIHRTLS